MIISNVEAKDLKVTLLDLLRVDEEFRYAVIGLLGLEDLRSAIKELQKAVAKLTEAQARSEERLTRLEEAQARSEERLTRLEEAQARSEERLTRLEEAVAKLTEAQARSEERLTRLEERVAENQARNEERFLRIENEIKSLREEHNNLRREMQEGFRLIDARLRRIETYIERTSLTLEDEAREIIAYRLKEKGLTLSVSNLILPDIEIDIYGVDTDTCVVGEVKTRASPNTIRDVDEDIRKLVDRYPEYLRRRVIKVVYTMLALPEAVREAEERGIWLVTAKGGLTELKL
ncbi:MAG: hypothetical protein QW514_06455 [Thermoprotei archaeon]